MVLHQAETVSCSETVKLAKKELVNNPSDQEDTPNEILDVAKSALTLPRLVFTDVYFASPMFPAVLLENTLANYSAMFSSGEPTLN